jgi:hypothetical protein
MDFVDHPVFNASETCHTSHTSHTSHNAIHNTTYNTSRKAYDEKHRDEMCEELLKCMGDDKTLQKKYERECGSSVYQLRPPDILWMA